MTSHDGHPGKVENDPYIGKLFVFDYPTVVITGNDPVTYVVLEYLPGQEPDDDEPINEEQPYVR